MAAAATSVLSLCDIPALADSFADGATSDSPGVLSGNTVQAPVNVPVNVCGNSVDIVGLLNPAFGNSCGNQSSSAREVTPDIPSQAGSGDDGSRQTPPPTGVVSTPPVARTPAPRLPAEQPGGGSATQEVQDDSSSTSQPRGLAPMAGESRAALAETGSGTLLATSALSAAFLAGGLVLYRRGRAGHCR